MSFREVATKFSIGMARAFGPAHEHSPGLGNRDDRHPGAHGSQPRWSRAGSLRRPDDRAPALRKSAANTGGDLCRNPPKPRRRPDVVAAVSARLDVLLRAGIAWRSKRTIGLATREECDRRTAPHIWRKTHP